MPKKTKQPASTVYVTVPEIAAEWDISPARVYALLSSGRVPGADCSTGHWRIPRGTPKPVAKPAGCKAKARAT